MANILSPNLPTSTPRKATTFTPRFSHSSLYIFTTSLALSPLASSSSTHFLVTSWNFFVPAIRFFFRQVVELDLFVRDLRHHLLVDVSCEPSGRFERVVANRVDRGFEVVWIFFQLSAFMITPSETHPKVLTTACLATS